MHKVSSLVGILVPMLVCLLFIQVASEVLYLRAIGYRAPEHDTTRPRPATVPRRPVHEVDRDVSTGALFT